MSVIKEGHSLINMSSVIDRLDINPGMYLGDFGCGFSGYVSFPLSKATGEDGKVYSIDVLQEALSSLKGQAIVNGIDNIETIWADLEVRNSVKLENRFLDRVALVNILFQVSNIENVIKESLRTVKIGGLLLISDWKNENFIVGPPEAQRVTVKKLREIAKSLNMKEVDFFDAGVYHYAIIFKKNF